MDHAIVPSPYGFYPSHVRPRSILTSEFVNGRARLGRDSILDDNPVVGLFVPAMTFGTDREGLGGVVTFPEAEIRNMFLTLRTESQAIELDKFPLANLITRATNAGSYLDFTAFGDGPRLFDLDNSEVTVASGQALTADRALPIYWVYMPAAKYQQWKQRQQLENAWRDYQNAMALSTMRSTPSR